MDVTVRRNGKYTNYNVYKGHVKENKTEGFITDFRISRGIARWGNEPIIEKEVKHIKGWIDYIKDLWRMIKRGKGNGCY